MSGKLQRVSHHPAGDRPQGSLLGLTWLTSIDGTCHLLARMNHEEAQPAAAQPSPSGRFHKLVRYQAMRASRRMLLSSRVL